MSGARGSSPGVQQVGAMARQGQLRPGSVTGVTGGPRAGLARPLLWLVLYLSAGPVTH